MWIPVLCAWRSKPEKQAATMMVVGGKEAWLGTGPIVWTDRRRQAVPDVFLSPAHSSSLSSTFELVHKLPSSLQYLQYLCLRSLDLHQPPSEPPVRVELTPPRRPQPSSTHTRRTQVLESGSEYARRRVCALCSFSPSWAYFPRLPDNLSGQLGRTHGVFLQPSPDISQFIPVEKHSTAFYPELGLYRSKSMPVLFCHSLKPQLSMLALFESVQRQT